MVNYDLVFFGLFLIFVLAFYLLQKKKFQTQGLLLLYRTKLGINASKKLATIFKWPLGIFGYLAIIIGFIGMFAMFYILVKGGIDILVNPNSQPVLAPVLPFVKVPGLPTLPFTYWIIGIFIIAVIHEFSHAVLSQLYKVRIKSSGFAFLGPLPAAFVEPDEKQLGQKSKTQQLAVLAGGSASNVITGILFAIILFYIFTPAVIALANIQLNIVDVESNSPAEFARLEKNMIITEINGISPEDKNFANVFKQINPGDKIDIKTDKGNFVVVADSSPQNKTKGYLGIKLETDFKAKNDGNTLLLAVVLWLQRLFLWLVILSIGIGLANLLPLGPIDGGRMFLIASIAIFKNEKAANTAYKVVTFITILFILLNLSPYIINMLKWFAGIFG